MVWGIHSVLQTHFLVLCKEAKWPSVWDRAAVNLCSFPFGFEHRVWGLVVLVSEHYLFLL